jgi:hypothetical protein
MLFALCGLGMRDFSSLALPPLHQRHSFFTAQEIEIHARGDWITNFLLKSVFHSAPTFTAAINQSERANTQTYKTKRTEREREREESNAA